jgi:hypothetical protein
MTLENFSDWEDNESSMSSGISTSPLTPTNILSDDQAVEEWDKLESMSKIIPAPQPAPQSESLLSKAGNFIKESLAPPTTEPMLLGPVSDLMKQKSDINMISNPPMESGPSGATRSFAEPVTLDSVLKKGTAQFVNTSTAQLPQAVIMRATGTQLEPGQTLNNVFFPGEWNPDTAQGVEKYVVGAGQAAGYMVAGLPKLGMQFTGNLLIKTMPWLSNALSKTLTRRVTTGIVREGLQFGAGSMTEQLGNIAMAPTVEDAVKMATQSVVSGAKAGGSVGIAKGLFPTDRLLRIATGMALLTPRPGSEESKSMDIHDRISNAIFTLMMVWHGYPASVAKIETDTVKKVKDAGLEKEVDTQVDEVLSGLKGEGELHPTSNETNIFARKNPANDKYIYSDTAIKESAMSGVTLAQEEMTRREAEKQVVSEKIIVTKRKTQDAIYLDKTKELKAKLGSDVYYSTLKDLGLTKSNQAFKAADKARVLEELGKKVIPMNLSNTELAQWMLDHPEMRDVVEKRLELQDAKTKKLIADKGEKSKQAMQAALDAQKLREALDSQKTIESAPENNKVVPPVETPVEPIVPSTKTPVVETPKTKLEEVVPSEPTSVKKLYEGEESIVEKPPVEEPIEEVDLGPEPEMTLDELYQARDLYKNLGDKESLTIVQEMINKQKGETLEESKVTKEVEDTLAGNITPEELAQPRLLFKNIGLELGKYEKTGEIDEDRIEERLNHLEKDPGTLAPEAIETLRDAYDRINEKWGNEVSEDKIDELLELDPDEVDRTDMESFKEQFPRPITIDMLGLQKIYDTTIEKLREVPSIENLRKIAKGIILEGKVKYGEFRSRMKEIVGDLWNDIKGFVRQTWKDATKWGDKVGQKGVINFEYTKKDVTLDLLGMQKLTEFISSRLFHKESMDTKLTREYINRGARNTPSATDIDLRDLRELGKVKGLSDRDIRKVAANTNGVGYVKNLSDLTRNGADILKIKIMDMKDIVLESEKEIIRDPNISQKMKDKLRKAVGLYEVSEDALSDFIENRRMDTGRQQLDDADVKELTKMCDLYIGSRPPQDAIGLMSWIRPMRKVLGDEYMRPWRTALVGRLEARPAFVKTEDLIFKNLDKEIRSNKDKKKMRERITLFYNGKLTESDLSPRELKASKLLDKAYDTAYTFFEIEAPKIEPHYSPKRTPEENRKAAVRFAFSSKGVKELDFWAQHERVKGGGLEETELDAQKLFKMYYERGLKTKFYNRAIVETRPLVKKMSPDLQVKDKEFVDRVILKRPKGVEADVAKSTRNLAKKLWMREDEGRQFLRMFEKTILDLNYAAYMGIRPKSAIRDSLQQWLVVNKYGPHNWLRGRLAAHSQVIKDAMAKSDMCKLRLEEYLAEDIPMEGMMDIPKEIRDKMMIAFKWVDLDGARVGFATGYLLSKSKHPKLAESWHIRAGEKAMAETAWLYGADLPFILQSPTSKLMLQYSSWSLAYADHIYTMFREKGFSKTLAIQASQFTLLSALAHYTGIDYRGAMGIGAMPSNFGFIPNLVWDTVKLLEALTTGNNVDSTWKGFKERLGGLVPGYLGVKEIAKLNKTGDVKSYLFYTKKEKKEGKTPKGLGSLQGLDGLGGL